MNKNKYNILKEKLKSEYEQLSSLSLATKDTRAPVELDQQSVGRLSRMDAMQQQSMDIAREERRQHRLKVIAAALARLDRGEYGYCLACGEDIPYKRLLADAATARCVDCSS